MHISHNSSVQQAKLVFDASTFNPFKKFKTTKPRLKAKLQRQLQDQPLIDHLIARLKYQKEFTINEFIFVAWQNREHNDDEHILLDVEKVADDNPDCLVIFITRDRGFTYAAGWHSYNSNVYIIRLPAVFFGKSSDQFNRLDMMKIIQKDITNLFVTGSVTFSRLYSPAIN